MRYTNLFCLTNALDKHFHVYRHPLSCKPFLQKYNGTDWVNRIAFTKYRYDEVLIRAHSLYALKLTFLQKGSITPIHSHAGGSIARVLHGCGVIEHLFPYPGVTKNFEINPLTTGDYSIVDGDQYHSFLASSISDAVFLEIIVF